jgi:hypothetical protein
MIFALSIYPKSPGKSSKMAFIICVSRGAHAAEGKKFPSPALKVSCRTGPGLGVRSFRKRISAENGTEDPSEKYAPAGLRQTLF